MEIWQKHPEDAEKIKIYGERGRLWDKKRLPVNTVGNVRSLSNKMIEKRVLTQSQRE